MNNTETWKVIDGFGGVYFASNQGRIKSIDRYYVDKKGKKYLRKGCVLKPIYDWTGYPSVTLSFSGGKKTIKVHRLVALTFCDGFEEGLHIHHINGIRDDNRPENLQWVTIAYNNRERYERGYKPPSGEDSRLSKLKNDHIPIIFSLYNSGVKQPIIAKDFGVSQATISNVITNKIYI